MTPELLFSSLYQILCFQNKHNNTYFIRLLEDYMRYLYEELYFYLAQNSAQWRLAIVVHATLALWFVILINFNVTIQNETKETFFSFLRPISYSCFWPILSWVVLWHLQRYQIKISLWISFISLWKSSASPKLSEW